MHKCILKPLKGYIENMLKNFRVADGSWSELRENFLLVKKRTPQELGVLTPTPDAVDVEKIRVKLSTMQKMYSPEKKVMLLLRICKLIYTCMENNSGTNLPHWILLPSIESYSLPLNRIPFSRIDK